MLLHCHESPHQNDVTWASWRIKSPADRFGQQLFEANNKERPSLLNLCEGINHWPVPYPHKGPVIGKSFPCHDVIVSSCCCRCAPKINCLCHRRAACVGMGLLPDTQNCGCACAGNAGNVFPVTAGERSRHASRHVRDARAVMHVGIAN